MKPCGCYNDPPMCQEHTAMAALWGNVNAPRYQTALEAIANMVVTKDTDHAKLSALCIAIARIALGAFPAESDASARD